MAIDENPNNYSAPELSMETVYSENGFASSDEYSLMSGGYYDQDERNENGEI